MCSDLNLKHCFVKCEAMNENSSPSCDENMLLLHDGEHVTTESNYFITTCTDSMNKSSNNTMMNDGSEKHSAIWTYSATMALLKLYENKLGMLETPKKKTRIWIAISESLKDYNIEMTADQVRWKINALTKKYKQSVDSEQPVKFKYFKEMNNIYAKYNVDCDTFTLGDLIYRKKDYKKIDLDNLNIQILGKSKAMIEMRKVRLINRIESDRTQSKLNLEKQWLEYLKIQEQNKLLQDKIFERNIKLKEEELDLRKQEMEIMESMELSSSQLKEIELEEMLRIDKEKCEIIRQFINKDL